MIISHKYKFIYISTPKTGSTSTRRRLKKYNSIRLNANKHANNFLHSHTEAAFQILKNKNFNPEEYFSFSCVRNPWSRSVSEYFFCKKRWKPGKFKEHFHKGVPIFREWVLAENANSPFANHDKCQFDIIQPHLISKVMRFENLQEDFNEVCDIIKIPRINLRKDNKTKHKHYTEYYDDETRQIVAEKYAKDIEYFGYKFGE